MKLTSDYRRVTALFNTPLQEEIEYSEYGKHGESIRTDFEVGPFVYAIMFSPKDDRGRTVHVGFELMDINASDEELVRLMSRFKKILPKQENDQEQEQTMTPQEAKELKRMAIGYFGHAELEFMGSYAIKIFSAVLNIVKDYWKKYRPKCITFDAASENRSRLYQRMVKSMLPNARMSVRSRFGIARTEIRVCFT